MNLFEEFDYGNLEAASEDADTPDHSVHQLGSPVVSRLAGATPAAEGDTMTSQSSNQSSARSLITARRSSASAYSAGAIREEQVQEDGSIEWSAAIPDGEAAALARLPGVTVEVLAPLSPPSGEHTTCVADRGYLQSTSTARRS